MYILVTLLACWQIGQISRGVGLIYRAAFEV